MKIHRGKKFQGRYFVYDNCTDLYIYAFYDKTFGWDSGSVLGDNLHGPEGRLPMWVFGIAGDEYSISEMLFEVELMGAAQPTLYCE